MPIQDVFQRYEKKYLLSESQYRHIRRRLEDYRMVPDQCGKSTICNIYFDTPDHRLIRRSLENQCIRKSSGCAATACRPPMTPSLWS